MMKLDFLLLFLFNALLFMNSQNLAEYDINYSVIMNISHRQSNSLVINVAMLPR